MRRQTTFKRFCVRFASNRSGTSAIEFAFVALPFLLFLFGTFEIAIVILFGSLLNDGAAEAASYLRAETMKCVRQGTANHNCTQANVAGIRQAVCRSISMGGMSCSNQRLKLAVYGADDPIGRPITTSQLIEEHSSDLRTSRAYVIGLGYEWPFALLTTKLLLTTQGNRSQLQTRVFYTTAERTLR